MHVGVHLIFLECIFIRKQTMVTHVGTDNKSGLDEVAQKKHGQDVEPGGTTCNETSLG